jgi:hypothetical protein
MTRNSNSRRVQPSCSSRRGSIEGRQVNHSSSNSSGRGGAASRRTECWASCTLSECCHS